MEPHVGGLKVGLEFISAQGPEGVAKIVELGRAGLRRCEIPRHSEYRRRRRARDRAARRGHLQRPCLGRRGDDARGRRGCRDSVDPKVRVLGVTVLTSLDESMLEAVGQKGPPHAQVERLATLAKSSGSMASSAARRRSRWSARPAVPISSSSPPASALWAADLADQRRVMAPAEAMAAGTDILVIGRPIAGAADPAAAARAIAEELRLVAAS